MTASTTRDGVRLLAEALQSDSLLQLALYCLAAPDDQPEIAAMLAAIDHLQMLLALHISRQSGAIVRRSGGVWMVERLPEK